VNRADPRKARSRLPEHWDVFHSERLEAERSLTSEAVRDALGRGELGEDDLVRPAGTLRWARIGDAPEFADLASAIPPGPLPPILASAPFEPPSAAPPPPPPFEPPSFDALLDAIEGHPPAPSRASPYPVPTHFEVVPDSDYELPAPLPTPRRPSPPVASPVLPDDEADRPDLAELDEPGHDDLEFADLGPEDDDDEAEEFTLSRNAAERVEELDLAAMVDVAFQLVLFFLVTASTVVFKTLEVPRPNEDRPPDAATQARAKSVDEMKDDYIIVKVDAAGAITIDGQAAPADRLALTDRLRAARAETGRKALLLSADFATRHRSAVLVFDVAGEIDLQIAIARPVGSN